MKRYWMVLGLLASPGFQAWADELPSKQNQQLQSQVQALEQRLGKLETLLQNQGLLSLLKDVEALKGEVARIEGQTELNAHLLDALGKRQTDLYQDLDHRLTELASRPALIVSPAKLTELPNAAAASPAAQAPSSQTPSPAAAANTNATPPGSATEASADPLVEAKLYEAALNQFRSANYVGAIAGFKGFAKNYPSSSLASNAQYWIGYSYYAMGDYRTAMAQQQKLLVAYPQSGKVPDALLNIARCQEELREISSARKTLEQIVAKHGGTNAAAIAARRLATLK
ncbi:MAG TPA: tol-pal system protein YbgF [Thiobacillaceae bacterium]|nr:tol-pal system protein YbgF [Thiobacillaceae bacterium]